jgi:hypothetical protein
VPRFGQASNVYLPSRKVVEATGSSHTATTRTGQAQRKDPPHPEQMVARHHGACSQPLVQTILPWFLPQDGAGHRHVRHWQAAESITVSGTCDRPITYEGGPADGSW